MASVPLAVVDAFTRQPFAGNPAGVCVLDTAADPAWMQQVAADRDELVAEQRSARGGRLHVRAAGDRVHLGGKAITVLTGQLTDAAGV